MAPPFRPKHARPAGGRPGGPRRAGGPPPHRPGDIDEAVLYGVHPVVEALRNPQRRHKRLLATENIQRGAFVRELPEIREMHSPLVAQIAAVLAAGEAAGIFRSGVDPVQLYITVAGVSYIYMSNIHTFSVVFDLPLASEPMMAARRAHAIEVVLGYLRPDRASESLAVK